MMDSEEARARAALDSILGTMVEADSITADQAREASIRLIELAEAVVTGSLGYREGLALVHQLARRHRRSEGAS